MSGAFLLLFLLVVWDLSARLKIIDLVSWPPFFNVAADWIRLLASGSLFLEILPTLRRVVVGYVIATVVAVPLGLLIGYSRRIHDLFEPTIEALRPISVVALIPVVVLFFGLEDRMKVFIVIYGCFFPILLNTIGGVRDIDSVLIGTARTFGLTRVQTMFRVMIPAAAPSIFTGMRISLGISLIAVVAAEMLTGGDGIGSFILDSERTFKVLDMYAGIITLGLIGYLANRGFVALERRLLRWHVGQGHSEGS